MIDYKQYAKKARQAKYGKLHSLKPWTALPYRQRHWLINYYKLRSIWQHLGYPLKDFPRLRDGPIIPPSPWEDQHHPLNRKLLEVEEVVKQRYGGEWRRWKNYKVGYYVITDLNEVI